MAHRSLVHRVANLGTLTGVLVGPVVALLVALLFSDGDASDALTVSTWYFSVQYVGVFMLARMLPFRGIKATLWAVIPALGIAALAFWWGGLGAGAALIVALALPNGPITQVSNKTYTP